MTHFLLSLLVATHAHAADDSMKTFVNALKLADKSTVAKMIHYPFDRDLPLQPIQSADEFLKVYNQYFDRNSVSKIQKDFARGTMERNGDIGTEGGLVWMHDGLVKKLNFQTSAYTKAWEAAKAADKVNAKAKGYSKLIADCSTSQSHVRVEKFGQDYRLFTWPVKTPITEEPKLALAKGVEKIEGTADNAFYEFKNGGETIEFDIPSMCSDEEWDSSTNHCRVTYNTSKGKEDCR